MLVDSEEKATHICKDANQSGLNYFCPATRMMCAANCICLSKASFHKMNHSEDWYISTRACTNKSLHGVNPRD